MAYLKVEVVDDADYTRFLSANPPDDPFSLLPFLEAYRDTFSCDFELLFVTRSGTPVASCALFVRKRFSQSTIHLMPIRTYDGVNFRKLDDSKNQKREYEKILTLQALEEYLEKNFSFHQMVFPPDFLDVRSFQWAGTNVIPQYTYIVDLESFSEENYTKSLREILRTAEHSGLTISSCSAQELVALHQISYERHHRKTTVPPDKLNKLLNSLNAAGLLDIKCVRNKSGKILSAMSWLRMDANSFLYLAGNDVEAEKGASNLLYHEILKSEMEKRNRSVDFCGANTPTINLFKSAFGPRLQVYFRIWRANSIVTRLASLVKKI